MDILIRSQSQFIETLVVNKDVDQVAIDLIVGYAEGVQFKESMIDDIQQLWSFRLIHHKYFHIGLSLLLFTNPISKMHSNKIWDLSERLIHDLNTPFFEKVEMHKSIMKMTTFNNFFRTNIHKNEFIVQDLAIDIVSTVYDCHLSIFCQDIVHIIAVQIIFTLDLNVEVEFHALSIVALACH